MKSKEKILNIAIMGVMVALLCVICPLSIPIGPVPVSLAVMVLYLIVYLFGGVKGTICCAIYILIGIIGVPVFSGYGAGLAKVAGPTGGYIVGYIFLCMICGGALWLGKGKLWVYIIGMVLGILVAYVFGSAWFMISLEAKLSYTLKVCVYPFLPFDAAKIVIIAIAGPLIKKPLRKIEGMDKVLRF